MIKITINKGNCEIKLEGYEKQILAEMMAGILKMPLAVCDYLGLSKKGKKQVMKSIIKDLKKEFR